MNQLETARKWAIILSIFFYVVAKAGCMGAPINFGGMTSPVGNLVLPVIVSIVNTIPEAFSVADDASFYAANLAIQLVGLGLALLSAVVAYAVHAMCKEMERR